VKFSPNGDCTKTIVSLIDSAHSEVKVQMYFFTSTEVAQALVRARRERNIPVHVLLASEEQNTKVGNYLAANGVNVFIDRREGTAHNKVMLVDRGTVVTGSFNFTPSAEDSNAEIIIIVHDEKVVSQYLDNWDRHREHSTRFGEMQSVPGTGVLLPVAAIEQVGKDCKVQVSIERVYAPDDQEYVILNHKSDYQSPQNLAVMVHPGARPPSRFANWQQFRQHLRTLGGRTVQVTGRVTPYRTWYEIQVDTPEQFFSLP
jgi:phosphatidylserine/phosphatidylglycerophosphate/cardiolipin synthase-like enzyme